MIGFYSQIPLGIVNPGLSIRYTTPLVLTYAEVQAMANGTNPRRIVGGVPGHILLPVSLTAFMDKSGAGSSCNFNIRWSTHPTLSIFANNVSVLFGNGGAGAITQRYIGIQSWASGLNGLATGTDCVGAALDLYMISNPVNPATGFVRLSAGYIRIRQ